jgi:chemotaxis protein methyltransferase CheR
MQALANLITTNETYMFREFEQLQAFADHCLPMILKSREAANDRTLRIWSAGCSSGEEPYTLAIILKEVMHDFRSWDIKIKATDIDQVRLEMARRAVYEERSVHEIPPEYFDRHITRLPAGFFAIKPETAKLVELEHLNLNDRLAMRNMRQFDFIFCRNVLIYFDDASRKAVVDHFYNALKPGGFIFLGHSESIGRISTAFKLLRVGQHLVYRKE